MRNRTGASRIILYGTDFAFPEGKSHVSGSVFARDTETEYSGAWVINGHGEKIPSLPNLVGYLRDLEKYISSVSQVKFFNASAGGARILGATFEENPSDI